MADKSRLSKSVARKLRQSPSEPQSPRKERSQSRKSTHNHDQQTHKRPSRFIRTEKSAEYKDKSKTSPTHSEKSSNQRQGTFVKEDSISSNEIVHPRIDSSSHQRLSRNKMDNINSDQSQVRPLSASDGERSEFGFLEQKYSKDMEGKSQETVAMGNTEVPPKAPQSSEDPGLLSPKPISRQPTPRKDDAKSPKPVTPVVQNVQNISPKERNVIVVSGATTPVDQSKKPEEGENNEGHVGSDNKKPSDSVAPAENKAPLEPPLVVTEAKDGDIQEKEPPGDGAAPSDLNLLSAASEKSSTPPPQPRYEDMDQLNTTQQDLEENWDQRSHVSRNSARTEKSSMPGEPILYKKPAKSAKRMPGYDPQEMLRNASRNQEEDTKPIFGTNWGTSKGEKSLEDERVLKLTEMLNQMGEQLSRKDEENKRLKSQNRSLEEQLHQHKEAQEKANTEVQLIKTEWQTMTKEMEAKQAENERLKQEALGKTGNEERMRELNEEQAKLRLENGSLKNDMKELLAARQNENKAHESRIKELEALMITKEAEVEDVKSANQKAGQEYESANQKAKEEYLNELKALKELVDRLQAENKALTEEIEVLKSEIQRQSEVIARLNAESRSGNNEVAKLRDENKTLTEEKLKFQIENASLKEKITELEKQIEQLKITIQNLNKENQQLLDSLSKAEKEIDSLKEGNKKVANVQQALELAIREKELAQKTLQDREKALATDFLAQEQLKMALQNSETQNEKLSKEVNNLSEENASLKQQVSTKSGEVEKLNLKVVELNERAENNSITLSSMADLVKEKQSHIEDLRKEIQTLKATNNNYFSTLENITSTRKQDEDVVKSKYEDMESAHKKLLEENKRLRTVLAHKNMNETNQDSEKQAFRDKLYETEKELSDAQERIQHLEAMLDDVYKAREITGSRISKQNGFFEDESESHQGLKSLPDIQSNARHEPDHSKNGPIKRDEYGRRSTKTSSSGRSWELRNYRYADSYSKRFENRPSKLKKTGVVTQLR